MVYAERLAAYFAQTGRSELTPRQWRRAEKKHRAVYTIHDEALEALRAAVARPSTNRRYDQRKPNLRASAREVYAERVTNECRAGRCANCWDDDCDCQACGHYGAYLRRAGAR